MSLHCNNLIRSYGNVEVLKGGTFTASKGHITALIGKNGAGKTTTFKIICGLLDTQDGELSWNDESITTDSADWKSKIGYLPEHNPLYGHMYIKEFLGYTCDLHGLKNKKEAIQSAINDVGLGEYQNKRINELSKGYKQRVGIAQALINDPQLLILDEPTSGLDPAQLIEIRALIKRLSENRVVILSSHILTEVNQICDSIYFINDGIIESVSTSDKDRIKLRFDRDISPSWFESLGKLSSISAKGFEILLDEATERGDLFDAAVKNEVRIVEMSDVSIQLEEKFMTKSNT